MENAIKNAFIYKKSKYSENLAEYLKELFEKSGSLKEMKIYLKNQVPTINISKETIQKYLFLLFEEEKYIKYKINGVNGYKRWYENNKDIIIRDGKVDRFGLIHRKMICRFIYRIIQKNCFNIDKNTILRKLKDIIDNQDLNGNFEERNAAYFNEQQEFEETIKYTFKCITNTKSWLRT